MLAMSIPRSTFRDTPQVREQWNAIRAFLDTVPVAVFETRGGPEDEIIYCNGVFAALLSTASDDLLGRSLADFGARPEDQERLKRDLGALNGARNFERPYQIRLKCRTGRELTARFDWLERSSEDGTDFGCLVVVHELDPPPLDEAASVRRVFYEIVERSGEAIGITAWDGTYLYRNQAHKELFGRGETPVGRLGLFELANERMRKRFETEIFPAIDRDGEWLGLAEFDRADGLIPVWFRLHGMIDPVSGKPIRFAFSHDYSDELARRTELADAKQKAEQAKKAQQDLFFAISHDFRAILQAVSLYLGAAERKASKQDLIIEEIGRARDAVFSVQDHFQKILDVLSKGASASEPKIEYVPGQEILDYIKHTYGPLAEAKGLSLSTGDCTDVFPTDPSLMKRIIGNLVSNAIKFTDEGVVRVECTKVCGKEVVRITDTGVGISEEYHDKVFEQFFRIDPEAGEGLGVGLSITRHLCELLGHRLELESTPGQGTIFTVTIDAINKSSD